MRISQEQAEAITQSISYHLGRNARIWLFGSRLDDRKKGGDLDLYVEASPHALNDEIRCKIALEEALDIPVDLIVRSFGETTPIGAIAKREGLPL
ncbi:nucleotidyltransferase domain-containing protein [Magnetovirga frankeli]|uniref:nucleotidyltransferase family protein n=1 Tax=Magnetovirga frankeli TaxID=947516 RepID=UPI001292E24C|nr:nucleotidyltransferase domain-containing protein [gamma proteobacterium SS-5]